MKELGPAAREFVESHRRDSSLSGAARARIKQKLMLRVSAIGATTAVAGTAAGMSLATKVVVVVLGVTGAVGAGSISVRALRSRAPAHLTPIETSVRTAPALPETTAAAAAAPARIAAPVRVAMPRVVAPPANARAARLSTTSIVAAAPAGPASFDSRHRDPLTQIDDHPVVATSQSPTTAAPRLEAFDPEPELQALREARDDLRAGRPASAYRRLEDFNRESPRGMLAQERQALSAIALCQAQPGGEAQRRAAEFLRQSPESPLAARVKSACERERKQSW